MGSHCAESTRLASRPSGAHRIRTVHRSVLEPHSAACSAGSAWLRPAGLSVKREPPHLAVTVQGLGSPGLLAPKKESRAVPHPHLSGVALGLLPMLSPSR